MASRAVLFINRLSGPCSGLLRHCSARHTEPEENGYNDIPRHNASINHEAHEGLEEHETNSLELVIFVPFAIFVAFVVNSTS